MNNEGWFAKEEVDEARECVVNEVIDRGIGRTGKETNGIKTKIKKKIDCNRYEIS